jgi:hypothetical protein
MTRSQWTMVARYRLPLTRRRTDRTRSPQLASYERGEVLWMPFLASPVDHVINGTRETGVHRSRVRMSLPKDRPCREGMAYASIGVIGA